MNAKSLLHSWGIGMKHGWKLTGRIRRTLLVLLLGGLISLCITHYYYKKECEAKLDAQLIIAFTDIGFYYLKQKRFNDAEKFARDILQIDRTNGHGLYLLCEALKEQDIKGSNEACEEYLINSPSIKTEEKGLDKLKGYFDERTAWVTCSLAKKYIQQANKTKDRELLDKACSKLLLCESIRPQGFKQISNSEIRQMIEENLGRPCKN